MDSSQEQLVSVVIPTLNRTFLLKRAIESVLVQTYPYWEMIVVVDGPDETTAALLHSLNDKRLRPVYLPASAGGSKARNTGVQKAAGKWIAFLDDDDIWLPEKLEAQMRYALSQAGSRTVVACKIIGRYPQQDYIWPRRMPGNGEPLCEYLFNRNSLFRGEGQIQTSMLLVPRSLMLEMPFTEDLSKHQDTDWYVRVSALDGFHIHLIEACLVIWYLGENRSSIVRHYDWERSWSWLLSIRHLLTPRAYVGFIATQLIGEAAAQGRRLSAGPFLLLQMLCVGSLRPIEFVLFLGNLSLGPSIRTKLRQMLSHSRA